NSLLQISEGATSGIQKMLERMKELATQSNSDTVDTDGRSRIDAEFQQLKSEITRTVSTTKFQGKTLLDGGFGNSVDTDDTSSTALAAGTGLFKAEISGTKAGTFTFTQAADGELTIDDGAGTTQTVSVVAGRQSVSFDKFGVSLELDANFDETAAAGTLDGTALVVAAGAGGGSFMVGSSGSYSGDDLLSLDAIDLTTGATGLNIATNDLTTAANAQTALTAIDGAIEKVNSSLGKIGAYQNRIENSQANLKTAIQNYSASESVIRDLDMAEEMTKFSKNQILAQAGTSMLAQANQSAQGVLSLLRG
ncbi:flagellin, partial [Longimicrobium sp.]|uniref:flagellin n=1 Tax=Longimicrobium sp. TaxID=2029185 RepID=UPI002E34679C